MNLSASLLIATGISSLVGTFFTYNETNRVVALVEVCIGFLLRSVYVTLSETLAALSVYKIKAEIRSRVFVALANGGVEAGDKAETAEIHYLVTRGIDSLEGYFTKFLPQLVLATVTIPSLISIFALMDWLSALLAGTSLVLIPLFMMLIGWATRKVQIQQLDASKKLSAHFLELLRGMLTLKAFNREMSQGEAILRVNTNYRLSTMKVLRVSFLSGFALELFASLSVALIAVSIGLRLVQGEISIFSGLFLIILAPEIFNPIRAVGANFHASSEGVTAMEQIFGITEGNQEQTFNNGQIEFERGVVRIVGPSGSGKSRMIEDLVGRTEGGRFRWLGDKNYRASQVAWMPQKVQMFEGSVFWNITLNNSVNVSALEEAIRIASLDDISLDFILTARGTGLSGGQLQRIALARAVYRLVANRISYLVLDEPTSAVDSQRTQIIRQGLITLIDQGYSIVYSSHDLNFSFTGEQVVKIASL